MSGRTLTSVGRRRRMPVISVGRGGDDGGVRRALWPPAARGTSACRGHGRRPAIKFRDIVGEMCGTYKICGNPRFLVGLESANFTGSHTTPFSLNSFRLHQRRLTYVHSFFAGLSS